MNPTALARLSVAATEPMIVPVRDFVRAIAAAAGLTGEALDRFELVVEECCHYITQAGFEPGDERRYEVTVERLRDRLALQFDWRGLPFDPERPPAEGHVALGLTLMRAFAEEIGFAHLGKQGMRITIAKALPGQSIAEIVPAPLALATPEPPAPATDHTRLRLMTTEDALALSRCIYRSYGYSYADFPYYPDRVRDLIERGVMTSIIATNEAGELVGHIAMLRDHPDDPVAESGVAVVDPRYRGRNLFKELKQELIAVARQQGLRGLYSEAIARHPFSQKGNITLGAHETGLMLGYAPPAVECRWIEQAGESPNRASVVLFYLGIAEPVPRLIYPPHQHRAIIGEIYQHSSLPRQLLDHDEAGPLPAGDGAMAVKLRPDLRIAFITLRAFGQETLAMVAVRLKQLCRQRLDVIYLDLDLGDPAAAAACAGLEGLGFSFAGILPDTSAGDLLRLQYLNTSAVAGHEIATASPFGARLRRYVLDAAGLDSA